MNEDELQEYREDINDGTLRLLVMIYALEIHGLPYISPFGRPAHLTDEGKALAEKVFFEEEEYRNEAMVIVDEYKKDCPFREDWRQDFVH